MSSATSSPIPLPVTYIKPGGWSLRVALREVWQTRELLYFLVWRDVKVRYKETVLGIAWAIVQPFFTMVVFTMLFGRLGKIPSDGLPYPLFAFAGLVPWTAFASSLAAGSMSLSSSRYLIAKVYFPRVLVPLSSVIMPVFDLLVSLGMLAVLMLWYGVRPGAAVVVIPLLIVCLVVTSFAVALWTSALTVRYRDMRYLMPFATQLLLFLTPVAYPASMLPDRFRVVYGLNPMATIVEGFKSALLGTPAVSLGMAVLSIAVVVIVFVSGATYFRAVENSIVDHL